VASKRLDDAILATPIEQLNDVGCFVRFQTRHEFHQTIRRHPCKKPASRVRTDFPQDAAEFLVFKQGEYLNFLALGQAVDDYTQFSGLYCF
jgi:hypothetical protein